MTLRRQSAGLFSHFVLQFQEEVIPVKDVDLLLSGGYVVVSSNQVIANGAVAIAGDRVVEVGPKEQVEKAVRAARTIDTTGKAVMPGLINAHNHPVFNSQIAIEPGRTVELRYEFTEPTSPGAPRVPVQPLRDDVTPVVSVPECSR